MLGRYVRLELDDAGTWLRVLGEQSSSEAITRQAIDVSAADSPSRRRIAGGIGDLELKAAGVVRRGPGLSKLKQGAYLGSEVLARLVNEDGLVVQAVCLVGPFERSANHNGAEHWSVTLAARMAPVFDEAVVVAPPAIIPTGGVIYIGDTVAITCATDGAVIHFTVDGTEPTAASPIYLAPFRLLPLGTVTVKAFAMKVGATDSPVVEAVFFVQAGMTWTIEGGNLGSGTTLHARLRTVHTYTIGL